MPIIGLLVLMCGILAGCKPEGDSDAFSVKVAAVGPSYVDLAISGPQVMEMAYVIDTKEQLMNNPHLIFATGVNTIVKGGETYRISNGLEDDTQYYLYVVAKLDEMNFSDILTVPFKTTKFNLSELVTVLNVTPDGYSVRLTVPESVKNSPDMAKGGRAIRYAQSCLMMYNYSKMAGTDDYSNLLYNGGWYTHEDKTILFSEETNWYETDYDYDGDGQNDLDYRYNPISPGEPVVFLAGEFEYMEDPEKNPEYEHDVFYYPAAWPAGYYLPMIDGSYYSRPKQNSVNIVEDINLAQPLDEYWTGAFQRKIFRVAVPEPMDEKVNIEVSDIGPVNARVTFLPDEGVEMYALAIMDDATYNQVLGLVNGRKDYLQWAITSYFGAFTFGSMAAEGPIAVDLTDIFYNVPSESQIHVLATAMGNSAGSRQSFTETSFYTTAKVLDAPEVVVTAVQDKVTPNKAVFNVKCTSKDTAPLKSAYYAANYKRDFLLLTNGETSYFDIAAGNYPFNADELALINSDEGLTMEIPSVDGETTRLVVVGYNAENTPNNLNYEFIEECPAVADCTTPYLDIKQPWVNTDDYADLCGEWTMTATLTNVGNQKFTHKSKLVISRHSEDQGVLAFDYPETLPQEVYDLYAKQDTPVSAEQVDAYYAEFKEYAERFGQYRLQDQNKLLCLGWFDLDTYNRLDAMSPYDLFVSETYSSVDVSSNFYDFGPKWYIEFNKNADGSVSMCAPVDNNFLPPASNYTVPFYFGGYDNISTYMFLYGQDGFTPSFPIERSTDAKGNPVLTVKPIVHDGGKFYPNMIGVDASMGGYIFENPVISDIVITKGWTETASQSFVPVGGNVPLRGEFPAVVVKPMTKLTAPVQYKKIEGSVMTLDKFHENADRLFEQMRKQQNN